MGHRYFHPYLRDPELLDSSGIIDFVKATQSQTRV